MIKFGFQIYYVLHDLTLCDLEILLLPRRQAFRATFPWNQITGHDQSFDPSHVDQFGKSDRSG